MIATAIEKYTIHDIGAPRVITSETQYDNYASALHDLVMKDKHTATERQYIELLTSLIEKYDSENHAIENAKPAQVLVILMEANNLKQKDLASLLGSESIVSEIVNGRRPFSKLHIEKLSKRFHVSPEVFFD
jgi:HTH-type transcriptional regulator / antitoxin HigA